MNVDQPSAIPSAAEQGIKAADVNAENKLVIDFAAIAARAEAVEYEIRLPAQWHMSCRPVFSIWQESRFILHITPPQPANLPGAHAGSEGK
jgi:hypothetical protein